MIYKNIITIALLMLSSTIFKSAEVIIKGEFDFKIFFKGALKHLLICGGVLLMYVAGNINPIQVLEDKTIIDLLDLLSIAIIIKYAISNINNLKELFDVEIPATNERGRL